MFKVGDKVQHASNGLGTITEVLKSWTYMKNGKSVTKRKTVYIVVYDGGSTGHAISHSAKTLRKAN